MIKRSFFGLAKPKLKSPVVAGGRQLDIKEIPLPKEVTLYVRPDGIIGSELLLKTGTKVRTGQKLRLGEDGRAYCISPVTGTVSAISQHVGYLGQTFRTISIKVAEEDQWDQEFNLAAGTPGQDTALRFMRALPGAPEFRDLADPRFPIGTILISGMDRDLLVATNRQVLTTEAEGLKDGIDHLKLIRPAARIVLVVPPDLVSQTSQTGAEVKIMEPVFPHTLPRLMIKSVLGEVPSAGTSLAEAGIGFVSAEAAIALGKAFKERILPVEKVLTVVLKNESSLVVKARIGTPVKTVLEALDIDTAHGDRLVFGGPMTGRAIFDLNTPIGPDTDALMIQDGAEIVPWSDSHCVNCGECVRVCPANVPVNMLIRFLENGLFEEAAERYDLFSCVECGLCSYVCIARIPIFHYIMLGKYEYDRMKQAEESNA